MTAKRFVMILVLLLASVVITLLALRAAWQHQTASRIKISAPGGIDSLEKVSIGGVEQWIQIRGHDRSKPLLLFLHGGPGFPQMPFSHLHAELEHDFVVVQWDQRGAGKSFSASTSDASMRVEQFVSDAHDLVQLLLRRFGIEKCYLVAHSWGSLFGAQVAARHPDLFHAYVGIGQAADLTRTSHVQYQFALDSARKENNGKARIELERIGPPPHSDADHKFMDKWVNHYSKREHSSVSSSLMVRLAFESPAYGWVDLVKIPLGFRYSFRRLWHEIYYDTSLFKQAPRIDVPVYFFLGRYDRVVTTEVAQNYFDVLDAPRGKLLIWFGNSGHFPHMQEPARFREELVRVSNQRLGQN